MNRGYSSSDKKSIPLSKQHDHSQVASSSGGSGVLIGSSIGDNDVKSKPSSTSGSISVNNKYTPIYNQNAVDERGQRRFHGAFTGGFSAGYYNTVGSKEGWTPSTFKSSKNDRATIKQYTPEDLMDDEDIQNMSRDIRTNQDYDLFQGTASFMKQQQHDDDNNNVDISKSLFEGVFKDIIQPNNDPIGLKLLKRMGWKDGQTRVIKRQKRNIPTSQKKRNVIVDNDGGFNYSSQQQIQDIVKDEEDDEEVEDEEDSDQYFSEYGKKFPTPIQYKQKNNTYGVGYEPSEEIKQMRVGSTSSTINQFGQPITNITSNRMSFGGIDQDDDVYAQESTSLYDIDGSSKKKINQQQQHQQEFEFMKPKDRSATTRRCSDGSVPLKGFIVASNITLDVKWYKPPDIPPNFDFRHKYDAPLDRAIINTPTQMISITPNQRSSLLDEQLLPSFKDEKQIQQEKLEKQQQLLKQQKESLQTLQQSFANRFVSAQEGAESLKAMKVEENKKSVKSKPKRVVKDWYPEPLLCKRFNVPNPHKGSVPSGPSTTSKYEDDGWKSKLNFNHDQSNVLDNDIQVGKKNDVAILEDTNPNTEYKYVEVKRPPMDLFKAIFESNDQDNDTDQKTTNVNNINNNSEQQDDYDPFSFIKSQNQEESNDKDSHDPFAFLKSQQTTTTTTTTDLKKDKVPIVKIDDEDDGDSDYDSDPFAHFVKESKKKKQKLTATSTTATKSPSKSNIIDNNVPIVGDLDKKKEDVLNNLLNIANNDMDDEEDSDPFLAFANQSKSNTSKPQQPIKPISNIEKEVSTPPLNQQPIPQLPSPPPPPKSYYQVIEVKPYQPTVPLSTKPTTTKLTHQQQHPNHPIYQQAPKGVSLPKDPQTKKKKNDSDKWVENIKSYLSQFSDDSSSSSSDSDQEKKKRKRKEKRKKKMEKQEKKDKKKRDKHKDR